MKKMISFSVARINEMKSRTNFSSPSVVLFAIAIVGLTITMACSSTGEQSATNNNAANSTASRASATPSSTPASDMSSMTQSGNSKSSPGAASAPYDLQFIDGMTSHHQSAIQMARLATEKAQHAELKSFARKIIDDQQKEITQMKGWRDAWYAGKPEAMNMEMPGMSGMTAMDMGKMQSATGAQFDQQFLKMMSDHHAGAISMAKEALKRAEHPEIKQLAERIIDAQQNEIGQMEKWETAWGNK